MEPLIPENSMPGGIIPPAVHVATPADSADCLKASPVGGSVILWDRPTTIDAALRVLPADGAGIALGASLFLDGSDAGDMAGAWRAGVRLIRWFPLPGADSRTVRESLIAASRQGFWNHIRFDGPTEADTDLAVFTAGSPNIAHSWQVGGQADAFAPAPAGHLLMAGYGEVTPLAGLPLWRHVWAPGPLLMLVHRWGKDRVRRRRVNPVTGYEWEIGTAMAWHFSPPAAISPGVMDEICRMVAAGGSVNTRWVRHNLERAFLIAYVTEQGQIVGNSSLKHPRTEYIAAVRDRYGLDFSRHLERGYTSVRPEYRGLGIGTRLLEGLTRRAAGRKIFSIIAEDNIATQKIAIRNRTRKVATVFSEAMGKEIGFWTPEEEGERRV